MTLPDYNSSVESIWRKLRPHMEWAEGFVLAVLFTSHPAPVAALRKRLEELLSLNTLPLRAFKLTDQGQVDHLLTTILSARPLGAKHPPIWLEMWKNQGASDENAELRSALWRVLSRLNERRFLLERDVACPLVLVLPSELRPDLPGMIPDLWSVRAVTADLPTPAAVVQERTIEPDAVPLTPLDREPTWAEREWAQLWEKTSDKKRLAPEAGFAAIKAAMDRMDLHAARLLVDQVEETLRTREETPSVLRQRSIVLDFQGDIEGAFGTPETARAAYAESLEIRRRLIAATGEAPQALRDLSVSLSKVGDVDRVLNRYEGARAAYAESLEIRRRLIAATGEIPQALRDLSVSLIKIGELQRALNNWTDARNAYSESLELCRRLIAATGETPQALHDLSVSQERVAEMDRLLDQ